MESSRTRDLFSNSPPLEQPSSKANIFRLGVVFNPLVNSLARWYVSSGRCSDLLEPISDFAFEGLQYVTEGFGRKPAMYIIWIVIAAVSESGSLIAMSGCIASTSDMSVSLGHH